MTDKTDLAARLLAHADLHDYASYGGEDAEQVEWAADLRAAAAALSAPAAPIDMVLHCPSCNTQHIDGAEELPKAMPGSFAEGSAGWANPPHRSHLCHHCGTIWRPADVPTNGVATVQTKGKADRVRAAPAAPSVPIPTTEDEAAGMVLVGEAWLREHAPHRLRAAAPSVPADAEEWLQHRFGVVRGHPEWRALVEAFNAGRAAAPPPGAPTPEDER